MTNKKLISLFLLSMMTVGTTGCIFKGLPNKNSSSMNVSTITHSTSSIEEISSSTTSNDKTSSSSSSSSDRTSSSSSSSSSSSNSSSSSSSQTPVPDNVDGNVRLEGEDGIIAGNRLEVQEGASASGGKAAAGLNDCGQGLFFIHYAPVGGVHDVEIGYYTNTPNSKHELVVNGVAQTVVYTENTGWCYEASESGKVTVQAEFEQGYNVITLSKKGTASDSPQYGGWAQVDYIEIKGTFEEFDKDNLVYDLDYIKVEAELGNYNSGALCPVGMNEASNGYIVGEINNVGHGATYNLTLPEEGRYALKVAYGKDGGARPININFDGTNYTYALEDYDGQSWNKFNLSSTAAILEFTEGEHTLSITRAENSNWFCFDYFVLEKVNDDEEPVEKVDPEVTVSIENGATLTIGVDEDPTVTVPEGVNYTTYYEQDEVKVSDTLPTTPGTYSFIVETEENDQYNAYRTYRWFRLVEPTTKETAEITFNYEAGTTYYIGGTERPTVTVSEGADYVITYESEAGYNSTEFPTEAGTYSLVVTVNENDQYKADKQWLWFRLVEPTIKVDAEITFNFVNGDSFIKGAEEKPEYTVSEGAEVEIYYYSEERDLAGETATFYSYEELIPGYAYSLNVKVLENDIYNAGSAWRWFRLEAPSTKEAAEITFNYEGGTTYYIGGTERPTVTVSEGADYVITYESESGYNSTEFPTEAGTYSLVVTVNENDLFKADKKWLWFQLAEPTTQTVRYEAENCVLDGTNVKIAENTSASNGSMAADINNCGQGLHFVHYSPVAGEFTMEVGYWTGSPNSKHDVFVDGVKQGTVVYTENTGWATGFNEAATTTITVNLKAGYNNVTVIKNGVASDSPEYGGWVQVDYLEIKGGVVYDPSATIDNSLSVRIEAELGYHHSGAAAPVAIGGAGNGYVVGEINAEGHGADFKIRVPESGTYELRIVYGKDGGARPVNINLDGTTSTYSLEDYDGQAWNVFHTSNVAATLTLDANTVHNLSITRAANSNWFCFDAIILTRVA